LYGGSGTSWAGNLPFWETLLPEAQNRTNWQVVSGRTIGMCG